jgi:peptidyl-tRNA hydrolase
MSAENMPISKMYVVVRQDIDPGYQIPQSIHAKDKFTHEYPECENRWYNDSNTIVVLGIENEDELLKLAGLCKKVKLRYSIFFEPDINEYTAIAIEPGQATAEMLRSLIPAGRQYRKLVK